MKIKNAVLWKEMTVDMKKARYIVLITTLVAVLAFGAASFVAILGLLAVNHTTIPYMTGSIYLTVCIVCEAIILSLIIPIFCAGSITSEREKQTMEILLTTKMSTWEIVKGKFLAPILLTALIVMCLLPILSVGYIYGGLPLWQLLVYTLLLIFWIMYICTFCIYCSAISTRTIFSLVLSFVIMILLMGVSIFLVIGACLIILVINEVGTEILRNYYPTIFAVTGKIEIPVFPPIYLLYFNPLVSFYELMVRMFGFGFDGESFTMAQIISDASNGMVTEKFVFSRFWLEISVVLQAIVGFVVMKGAAKVLNPIRNAKKRMKRNEKRIAEIEATREQKRRLAINNGTYQEQMEQVWGPEGAQAAEWAATSNEEAAAETSDEGFYPFAAQQQPAQPQAQPIPPVQPQVQPQPQTQAQPFVAQPVQPEPQAQPFVAQPVPPVQPQAQPVPPVQPQAETPYPFGNPTETSQAAQPQTEEAPYPFSSPKKEDDGYQYPFGQNSSGNDSGSGNQEG